jgi:hypothetical protein
MERFSAERHNLLLTSAKYRESSDGPGACNDGGIIIDADRVTGQGGRGSCVSLIALAVYVMFLLYRGSGGRAGSVPLWNLDDLSRFPGWIGGLVLMNLLEFAYFVPLGFIAAMVVARKPGRGRRFLLGVLTAGVAGTLTVAICGIGTILARPQGTPADLVLPLLGSLLGAWAGMTWLRGWRARLWFLPKVALLVSLPVLCVGVLLWLSLEARPLPLEAAQVTSEEKRRLVSLIRSRSPRSLEEGQTHTLNLTEHDIDVLLAWGLSIGWPGGKARVSLVDDSAAFSMSAGIPLGKGTRYLNLVMAGGVKIQDGVLAMNVERCTVGSVEAPHWLLDSCAPLAASLLNHDPRSKPFVRATRGIAIQAGSIKVTYGRVHLPSGYRESLFGPAIMSEEVRVSTRAQVAHLLAAVGRSPQTLPTFGTCMETVFALARDRSHERDPVIENQAAIFALGVLLGHPRVEEFLGPIIADEHDRAARRALLHIRLRGRSDWTKHFCVSAAIAMFSNVAVSDAAGLLKEELDAGRGGSGFSFSDLLADRAGTTFAICATRNQTAARAMQDRLVRGFRVEEFFPQAADLPEGIPDAELQRQYGGVGGDAYRGLLEEIERRIASCAAYQ